jgi:hypothetical protein
MTTLLEQAAADEGGWTVSPVMQLKNLQMAQILYKGQPARIQVVPRGDMSLRIPFAQASIVGPARKPESAAPSTRRRASSTTWSGWKK